MVTIVGSLTSPFVRFTRVVCEELNVPYELDLTTFFANNNAKQEEAVRRANPLMRVPVLLDGENEIIDSRIIVRYLLQTYGNNEVLSQFSMNFDEENRLSVVLGLIDSAVLGFIMLKTQEETQADSLYMVRNQERIKSALTWLNEDKKIGERLGLVEIALICGLEWFSKRGICPWHEFAHLKHVHQTYSEHPSIVNTRIPDTV